MLKMQYFEHILNRIKTITKQYKNNIGKFNSENKLEVYKSEILFLMAKLNIKIN